MLRNVAETSILLLSKVKGIRRYVLCRGVAKLLPFVRGVSGVENKGEGPAALSNVDVAPTVRIKELTLRIVS